MNKTIVVVAIIAVALLFAFNSKSAESFAFGLDGKGVRYLCPVEQTYNTVTSKCEDKPDFIGRPPVFTLD